jgi:hypothetical protein
VDPTSHAGEYALVLAAPRHAQPLGAKRVVGARDVSEIPQVYGTGGIDICAMRSVPFHTTSTMTPSEGIA